MNPEVIAGLHPPRLPAAVVATHWQDLLAAFGLGLLVAALLAFLLAPLLRPRPRRESLRRRLDRLAALPPEDRLLGQLRLLAETGTPLPDDLRARLYARTPPNPATLDAL
ncbi:hypothetical protein, partial [Amaricoccus sp.]|uniref:hypothetical protein n=1 Tax=Amaricoccus sp. TaxID=1872485 RepID=UPI001B53DA0D